MAFPGFGRPVTTKSRTGFSRIVIRNGICMKHDNCRPATEVAVLSGVTTFLNPNKREASHLAAAYGFDKINNDARVFWSVECWLEKSEIVLTAKLRELIDRKNDLNGKSPQIPNWAYQKAKKGIAAGEAEFKVDQKPNSPALTDQSNQQPPGN